MTFGQHLEELRSRLLRAILGFVVVAAATLLYQQELLKFYVGPYGNARESIRARTVESGDATADPQRPLNLEEIQRRVSALDGRLQAVRKADAPTPPTPESRLARLEEEMAALVEVLAPAKAPDGSRRGSGVDIGPLRSIHATEMFFAYLKAALLTAALVSAPFLLYQLWQFIAAGLYPGERSAVMRTLPMSVLLFAVGLAFGFLVLVPVALDFLLSYGDPEVVRAEITIGSYMSLMFVLLFVMGLVFQVPLVMTVVARMGLVQPSTFRKNRRYFIVGAFIAAALLTPPDYVTQLLVAIPMLVLFELGIYLSVIAARQRARSLAGKGEENA